VCQFLHETWSLFWVERREIEGGFDILGHDLERVIWPLKNHKKNGAKDDEGKNGEKHVPEIAHGDF